jgi:hypothetical protein
MLPAGCFLLAAAVSLPPVSSAGTTVDPPAVHLRGAFTSWSLLVSNSARGGRPIDWTHVVRYRSLNPEVARVSPAGVVQPVADGSTEIVVETDGHALRVPVMVEGTALPRRFNFANDIEPVLSRFGCNASGCHGKAEGQNGFKLSIFGFDPAADFAALVEEGRGRRVFPAVPEQSLLLRKMSGQMPHGGGARVPRGSAAYETLRAWVAAGMPVGSNDDPAVVDVRVEPAERVLAPREGQQLRVVARYTDGHETDVTAHAKFQSNNDALASVDAGGEVHAGDVPGGAAVMASYMNFVNTFRVVVPRPGIVESYPRPQENNFIDSLVFANLRRLNIAPSELSDDAAFLRRVALDVTGTLPTAAEARRFLADRRPDRRVRLVEELLGRPEYADFWALQWSDLLRVDRSALGHKLAYAYYRWVRDGFVANKPLDRFARELLTAEGLLGECSPADFYKVVTSPGVEASTLTQVLLGVRIACAECHHHPYDRWSQTDYYGMAAFFNGISVKGTPGGEALVIDLAPPLRHPRTGKAVYAHALGEPAPAAPASAGQRAALADWLTRPENPWFARNLANRYWAHFLGRGLVEPVDDVRATNPPSNPELLDALARYLVENRFDAKALIRAITASRTYQLSSQPNTTNERDEQNYSRAMLRRPEAEVLLDMVSQVTGVPERFAGTPPGTRALQLWDSKVPHYFLRTFGRPERISACECERQREPSVAQVLHLLNAREIHEKLSHDGGSLAKLARHEPADGPLVEELYLTFYARPPGDDEKRTAVAYLREHEGKRRQAVEDLGWGLLNTLEFLFNH